MRTWKLIGLAGLAGVATTAAIAAKARQRRSWTEHDPSELRARLHERLEASDARAACAE